MDRDALLLLIRRYALCTSEAAYWTARRQPRTAQTCQQAADAVLAQILDTLSPEESDEPDVPDDGAPRPE